MSSSITFHDSIFVTIQVCPSEDSVWCSRLVLSEALLHTMTSTMVCLNSNQAMSSSRLRKPGVAYMIMELRLTRMVRQSGNLVIEVIEGPAASLRG